MQQREAAPILADKPKLKIRIPINSNWYVAIGFLLVIFVGTFLLMLPQAQATGTWGNFITSLFTATSATCVTGLSVCDITKEFSTVGQVIIMSLIEIGGLGIMMFGTMLMLITGRRLSVNSESAMMSMYGMDSVRNVPALIRSGIAFFLFFESCGTAMLAWRYMERGYPLGKALWYGAFHSVSAFCNAGFALHSDSICSFSHDGFYGLTIASLLMIGGIGFLVLRNVATIKFWRRDLRTRGKLSLHSRMVLTATFWTIAVSILLWFGMEYNGLLKDRSLGDAWYISFFQIVSPRTAGFTLIDTEQMTAASQFLTLILMFIGGAPGSTAGGIKVTTLMVILLTLAAMFRGRVETEWRGRTIANSVVRGALAIFFLYLTLNISTFLLLLVTESVPHNTNRAMRLLFETVSAYGTVGLSINMTPLLSEAGRIIISIAMFIGRVGPLTLIMLLGSRGASQRIRYPEEDITVG